MTQPFECTESRPIFARFITGKIICNLHRTLTEQPSNGTVLNVNSFLITFWDIEKATKIITTLEKRLDYRHYRHDDEKTDMSHITVCDFIFQVSRYHLENQNESEVKSLTVE